MTTTKKPTTTMEPRPRTFTTKKVTLDPQTGKALNINLLSLSKPHMRSFHLAWLGFFAAFTGWFAYAPILKLTVGPNLGMTAVDVSNSDIANVSSTVVFRVLIGPLVDKLGPSRVMALLLFLGSLPLGFSLLSTSTIGIITSRLFIGILGATFVPCQYWTTALFAPTIVGTANAIAGGWGNMGAGVTNLVMPRIYSLFYHNAGLPVGTAWRVSMLIPVALLWIVALLVILFGEDKVHGSLMGSSSAGAGSDIQGEQVVTSTTTADSSVDGINATADSSVDGINATTMEKSVHLEKTLTTQDSAATLSDRDVKMNEVILQQKHTSFTDLEVAPPPSILSIEDNPTPHSLKAMVFIVFQTILNPNVIILMIHYACSFGVELSVDGALGNYFITTFGMDQNKASLLGGLFGLINLFSRATGGLISDWMAHRYGMVGRLWWQAGLFAISAASLMVFSILPDTTSSIVMVIVFSYSVQAGCGSTFGIVPFVGSYMGTSSGLIGAGGSIGGALFNVLQR
ncbi:High-affinity nitrate transporter 2.1, partial [Blyttiomyces sp. JEL0837]